MGWNFIFIVQKQAKLILDASGGERLIGKGNKRMFWGDRNFLYTGKINKNLVVVSPGDFNAWSDLKITVMKRIPWLSKWLGITETKKIKTTKPLCVWLFVQVQLFRQKVLDPVIHHFRAHNNYLGKC